LIRHASRGTPHPVDVNRKAKLMNPDDVRKPKRDPQKKIGLRQALEGVVERLRKGLENIAEGLASGLRPGKPQHIPVPIRQPRRR